MAQWHRAAGLGVLVGCLLAGPSRGADFNLEIKTGDIKLGESLLGPKLGDDDLKGRVVLLEFWGIR